MMWVRSARFQAVIDLICGWHAGAEERHSEYTSVNIPVYVLSGSFSGQCMGQSCRLCLQMALAIVQQPAVMYREARLKLANIRHLHHILLFTVVVPENSVLQLALLPAYV